MKIAILIAVLLLPFSMAISDERLTWLTEDSENLQKAEDAQTELANSEAGDDSSSEEIEDLDSYIGDLESELEELNEAQSPVDSGSASNRLSEAVRQLTANAKSALQSSSRESLQSEFRAGGAVLSDARAEVYMAGLLATLNAQN